jgi:hypothetical protein
MASFVLLLKEFEDENTVIYRFGPNEAQMGKIELNKKKETINEVESIKNANHESKFYFDRAAQRLARCFYKEKGIFPDKMTFES